MLGFRSARRRQSWQAPAGHRTTLAWLTGYRRLTLRYERHASHFVAFLTLAATVTCYKKLIRCTT